MRNRPQFRLSKLSNADIFHPFYSNNADGDIDRSNFDRAETDRDSIVWQLSAASPDLSINAQTRSSGACHLCNYVGWAVPTSDTDAYNCLVGSDRPTVYKWLEPIKIVQHQPHTCQLRG